MRFGMSFHIFYIDYARMVILFITLTNIYYIVENVEEICFECIACQCLLVRSLRIHIVTTLPRSGRTEFISCDLLELISLGNLGIS